MKVLSWIFFLSCGFFALGQVFGRLLGVAFDVPVLAVVSILFGSAMYFLYTIVRRRQQLN